MALGSFATPPGAGSTEDQYRKYVQALREKNQRDNPGSTTTYGAGGAIKPGMQGYAQAQTDSEDSQISMLMHQNGGAPGVPATGGGGAPDTPATAAPTAAPAMQGLQAAAPSSPEPSGGPDIQGVPGMGLRQGIGSRTPPMGSTALAGLRKAY